MFAASYRFICRQNYTDYYTISKMAPAISLYTAVNFHKLLMAASCMPPETLADLMEGSKIHRSLKKSKWDYKDKSGRQTEWTND